jgi:drug/metabolite transporter (DMT)-like permease
LKLIQGIILHLSQIYFVSLSPSNKKAYVAVIIVSFFWGTTYLVARVTVEHIPGLFLAGVRNLLAGSAIVLFFLLRGYKLPSRKIILQSAFIGFVMVSFSSGLSTWSVQYISGGLAAIIGATIPLWIALFSMSVNKSRKFSLPVLAGLLLGFAGIAIIFYDHLAEMLDNSFRKGIILASVSCITWAAGSVYASSIKLKTNILFGAGLQMLFAGIFVTIASMLLHQTTDLLLMPRETWYGLLYLVVIGSVLTYSSYVYAISHLPPARVGVYAYINPIVAIVLGNILLNERLNFMIVLGAMVTISGVYLVNSNLKKIPAVPLSDGTKTKSGD